MITQITGSPSSQIFHPNVCNSHAEGEDPAAWSLPYYAEPCPGHGSFPCADPFTPSARPHAYYANQTATDAETPDGMIVRAAAAALRNFSAHGRFASEKLFLAAGIHRPHLPEIVPASYIEQYDPADIPPPDNPNIPKGLPKVAWNDCGEIRSYTQVKEVTGNFSEHVPFPPGLVAGMRRGYFAAQTFADAQVGYLLDAVKDVGLSLDEDVCVVLWGGEAMPAAFVRRTRSRKSDAPQGVARFCPCPPVADHGEAHLDFVIRWP